MSDRKNININEGIIDPSVKKPELITQSTSDKGIFLLSLNNQNHKYASNLIKKL